MDHTKELIALAHEGDKGAREQLVEENMGLVYSVARKFAAMGQEFDDMVQLGAIGLIKCVDRFDLAQEVKFSTYAVPMIIGEMKRFLRDDGIIKVSRTLKENQYKIKRAESELAQKLGRDATIEEVAAWTGILKEDIVLSKEACTEVHSIYQTVGSSEENDGYIIDRMLVGHTVCQEDGALEDEEKTAVLNRLLLEKMLDTLTEKERRLIELRYYEDKTQVQAAAVLGMTQVQVSRLEKKILAELRRQIT